MRANVNDDRLFFLGWTIILNLHWVQEVITFLHPSHKFLHLLKIVQAKYCSFRAPTVSPLFCIIKKVPRRSRNGSKNSLPKRCLYCVFLSYIPHDRESETLLRLSHTQDWIILRNRNMHCYTVEGHDCHDWGGKKQNKAKD